MRLLEAQLFFYSDLPWWCLIEIIIIYFLHFINPYERDYKGDFLYVA